MSQRRDNGFNPAIHGARGLFAMMVFVYHVVHSSLPGMVSDDSWISHYLLGSFQSGVELFFGISGFVILSALSRAASVRSFLWDRATRIFPLLWITLLVITLASWAGGRWLPSWNDWLLNFLAPPPFIRIPQLNPAAWSLGYELTFYALCAVCWYVRRRGGPWQVLAVVAGLPLLVFFPRAILFPAGLLIGAGSLLAAGRRWRDPLRQLARWPGVTLLAFLLCWRAVELGHGGHMIYLTPAYQPLADWLPAVPLIVAASLLGGLALFGIAEQQGLLSRWLRTAPLQWLGTISYSFYLWHPVVMGPVKQLLKSAGIVDAAGPAAQLIFAVVALPPALVVAHFSQIWIEARLTRVLRRAGPREGKARTPVTAQVHAADNAA